MLIRLEQYDIQNEFNQIWMKMNIKEENRTVEPKRIRREMRENISMKSEIKS